MRIETIGLASVGEPVFKDNSPDLLDSVLFMF